MKISIITFINWKPFFFENIEKYIVDQNVGHKLFEIMKQIPQLLHPCPHFPHEYLQKFFIRFRIFYVLKYSNRDFKTVSKKNRKLCILMNL